MPNSGELFQIKILLIIIIVGWAVLKILSKFWKMRKEIHRLKNELGKKEHEEFVIEKVDGLEKRFDKYEKILNQIQEKIK